MLFGTVLFGVVLLTVLAWRLAQGPVDLGFLTGRVEAALNVDDAPTRIKIGAIALAWEGFNQGLDRPLDLRLRDVAIVDANGRKRLEVPRAAATLSVAGLLIGRIVPRAVELDGVRLTATRGADNTINIDVGSLSEIPDAPTQDAMNIAAELAELMRPWSGDFAPRRNLLSQLRRIRVRDLGVLMIDQALGITWTASGVEFDLLRRSCGGIDLSGSATLIAKDQHTDLTLTATSASDLTTTVFRFGSGPVVPAALGLPTLATVDAPLSIEGSITLSRTFVPRTGAAVLHMGTGTLHVGTGTVPVRMGSVAVGVTPGTLTVDSASLILTGADGRPDTTLTATGVAKFGPLRTTATMTVGFDRIAIADLPRFWPEGVGGGARPWLVENVAEGVAHDGHVMVTMEANNDFSDLTLTSATGLIEAEDLTVSWLRPVPPIEQGRASIRIVDPDTIDIAIAGGRQRVGARTPITVSGGLLHMTGMEQKDQIADITMQANGPLGDIIALLKEPRLQLLSKHPLDLRNPSGDGAVTIKVKLPLENKVTMDGIDIGVTGHLRQGHLSSVAAGRDLDKAELDIAANKDQLTLKGTGTIGGIAATMEGSMNFQAGRPQDVTQRITVTGKPNVRQLTAAGLDLSDVLSGDVPLSAVWSQQRGGGGDIAVDADLTSAAVTVHPLAWQKPAGIALKASAKLRLTGDRLSSIDSIVADGPSVTVRASADLASNRLTMVRLDRLVVGRNDLTGSVRLPPGGPIAVTLTGGSLDVGAKLTEKSPVRDRTKPEPPPGPAWTMTGHFGRVLLAHDVVALNVDADAANDGRVFTRLRIQGTTQPAARFSLDITLGGGVRRMTAMAADAGAFLRGLDAIQTMQGGVLNLNGTYDDSNAAHAVTGNAEITDFRIRNAPAFGKLLQAMTLYGLVDVIRGPGLGFARLIAPFTLSDEILELRDARAFSPSLGMTAKGRLDMNAETVDIEGTIVPAYYFNSLLGRIPFVGGLFRTEEGGGVFAARYTLRGPLSDPSAFVNPLSMLTPGFLRKLFGIF